MRAALILALVLSAPCFAGNQEDLAEVAGLVSKHSLRCRVHESLNTVAFEMQKFWEITPTDPRGDFEVCSADAYVSAANGSLMFGFSVSMSADDWAFYNTLIVNVDGAITKLIDEDPTRDVKGGRVYENVSFEVDKWLIQQISAAKDVTLLIHGTHGNHEIRLSESTKKRVGSLFDIGNAITRIAERGEKPHDILSCSAVSVRQVAARQEAAREKAANREVGGKAIAAKVTFEIAPAKTLPGQAKDEWFRIVVKNGSNMDAANIKIVVTRGTAKVERVIKRVYAGKSKATTIQLKAPGKVQCKVIECQPLD